MAKTAATRLLSYIENGKVIDNIDFELVAKEMLRLERQQIEEAFNDGFYDLDRDGSDYYQSKYTESKGE